MDIYADLPSANTGSDASGSSGSSSSTAPSSTAPKGSWAHSKFQGMIAKRRTATAASSRMALPLLLKRPGSSKPLIVRPKEKVEGTKSKSKPSMQPATPASPVNRPRSWDMGFGDVEDDYDPFHPNDYMEYCRERINRKKQEERDRELKIMMEEQERERKRQDEERAATIRKIQEAAAKAHEAATNAAGGGAGNGAGLGAGRGGAAGGAGTTGAAAAAAVRSDIASLETAMGRGRGRGLSNLPAWLTKAPAGAGVGGGGGGDGASGEDGASPEGLQEPPTPARMVPPPAPGQFENAPEGSRLGPPARGIGGGPGGAGSTGGLGARGTSGESGMNFAERMMAKMGHKEGQGLGASRQGISQPLQSMSAGGGMGVIEMHQADRKRLAGPIDTPPAPPARKKRGLFSNPTRVLLLKNMVGPGEVDDDLEAETQGECERFGPVRRCLIYEMKGGDTPESERVRIFIAFEKQESAVKAYLEMNGRFFGGRQIAASFYKEDKFDGLDLEPQPDEEKS